MIFRRAVDPLHNWTRDVVLTSGRPVRVTLRAAGAMQPYIQIEGAVNEGETREVRALLAEDPGAARLTVFRHPSMRYAKPEKRG